MGLVQHVLHRLVGKGLQIRWHLGRVRHRRLLGVGVQTGGELILAALGQTLQHIAPQFGHGGGPKAHRIGHALAHRCAFVRIAGRQVKHVSGVEHHVPARLKFRQNFQRHARLQRQIFLRAVAPTPLSLGLHQKHVVAVKVRPHPTAIAGPTDHQIVQAGVGHKAKGLQKISRRLGMQIHALHEQRPVGLGKSRALACAQRPVAHLPVTAFALHQA